MNIVITEDQLTIIGGIIIMIAGGFFSLIFFREEGPLSFRAGIFILGLFIFAGLVIINAGTNWITFEIVK